MLCGYDNSLLLKYWLCCISCIKENTFTNVLNQIHLGLNIYSKRQHHMGSVCVCESSGFWIMWVHVTLLSRAAVWGQLTQQVWKIITYLFLDDLVRVTALKQAVQVFSTSCQPHYRFCRLFFFFSKCGQSFSTWEQVASVSASQQWQWGTDQSERNGAGRGEPRASSGRFIQTHFSLSKNEVCEAQTRSSTKQTLFIAGSWPKFI